MFNLLKLYRKEQEAEAVTDAPAGNDATDDQAAADTESNVDTEHVEAQDNTKAEDDKGDNDKADESKADDKSDDGDEGKNEVPEKYDFQMPEGIELDQALADKFSEVAKRLNLNNEQANEVAALHAETVLEAQKAQTEVWDKQVADWQTELQDDAEFGGANFQKNAEIAKIAINKFGGDDLKTALNETGLGNHPALVKFMHKVGISISEDSFDVHSNNDNSASATAQGLYKNSNMNP